MKSNDDNSHEKTSKSAQKEEDEDEDEDDKNDDANYDGESKKAKDAGDTVDDVFAGVEVAWPVDAGSVLIYRSTVSRIDADAERLASAFSVLDVECVHKPPFRLRKALEAGQAMNRPSS